MLLYYAVQPFGLSPPPPVVCWTAGTVLVFLSIASAYGAYHYGKAPGREAVSPVATSPIAKAAMAGTGTSKVASNGAPKTLERAGIQIGMREAIFDQPARQQSMGSLFEALIQAAPRTTP
jgi:hypothetical protein